MNLIILSQHRPNLAGHRASFDEAVEVSRIVTSIRLGIFRLHLGVSTLLNDLDGRSTTSTWTSNGH